MKKEKGCLTGCLRIVVCVVLFTLGIRLLAPTFFTAQTLNYYIRTFILRQMFRGPLEDWWGEMVRSAIVERRGKVVYAGLGTYMGVFSLEDSGKITLTKKISLLGGFTHGFAQDGNMLYVVAGATGLHIFDVSQPENPKLISTYLTSGYGLGIAVSKGTAYIGDEENGLVILDVRNPRKPQEVSHIKKGNVNFVLVRDKKAYVADGYRGVVIYDVSNPAKPKYLGSASVNYHSKPKPIDVPPLGLALYEHYLLVANGERGLDILDVKNPRAPKIISQLPLHGFSYSVIVDRGTACVADIVKGLIMINVANPKKPKISRTIKTPGQAFDVMLWKRKLAVSAGAGGLYVLDMMKPESAVLTDMELYYPLSMLDVTWGWKITGSYTEPATTFSLTLRNNHLFTANGSGGINVYDIKEDAAHPVLLSHLDTPGYAHRIAISGNLAYIADVIGGAQVVDISNVRSPKIIHTFDYQQHPWDVAVSGKYAYIADAHHGFSVFDTSNPTQTKFLANYDLKRYAVGVDVKGKYAYVADLASFLFTKGGLFIFDIENPKDPQLLGSLSMRGLDVAVEDKMAYLAAYNNGLVIVNAKNSSKPEILSRFKTRGYVYGVAVDKTRKRAYAADYQKGIFVLDVKNIRRPSLIKNYRTKGTPYAVAFNGNFLYIADGKKGLAVLNLSSGQITYP